MIRFLDRFVCNTRGTITIITAGAMTMLLGAIAVASDLSYFYLEKRTAQGVVDLAAISAANDLDRAHSAALATVAANNLRGVGKVTVERGRYTPNLVIPQNSRFVPNLQPFNAARVTLKKRTSLFFGKFLQEEDKTIEVAGTSATANFANLTIGSRLLSLNGGLANIVLSKLIGGNVSLDAVDYEALASASFSIKPFLTALGVELGINAVTYREILNAEVSVSTILDAAIKVLEDQGDNEAANVAATIIAQSNAFSFEFPLNRLVDIGPYAKLGLGQSHPTLETEIDGLLLLSTSAVLANMGKQIDVDLTGQIANVSSIQLQIAIGEPALSTAVINLVSANETVYTSQVRLRLRVEIDGASRLKGTTVNLPFYIDTAYASAKLDTIDCSSSDRRQASATVSATPGVFDAWIGDIPDEDLSNFEIPALVRNASLVTTPLFQVTGRAHIESARKSPAKIHFAASDIENRILKSTNTDAFTETIIESLIDDMDISVEAGRLSVPATTSIAWALKRTLSPIAPSLDAALGKILQILGIRLGEVDLTINGATCGTGVLAG